jgi:cobalt-zinc-cadmium efflux system membrane fusion protein
VRLLVWGHLVLISIATGAMVSVAGCQNTDSNTKGTHEEEAQHFSRGAHNGRVVSDGDFSLEVTIYEEGVEPRFRIYPYTNDRPVLPASVDLTVVLTRLGGVQETFTFRPVGDFLTSEAIVSEPHSFQVDIKARHDSKDSAWSYDSFEARTSMARDIADHAGIEVATPQPRTISVTKRLRGKIVPSEHRIAHVIPRFSGIVKEGRKHIGDRVEKGEVLAIVESNQSLQPFEIRSQISGTVINGHLIVGEFVPDNQWVYIVADLSEVWADFFLPIRDRGGVTSGQRVMIGSPAGGASTEGRISYLAPYADEKSQAQLVRAVIPNAKNDLLPGMFITGDVVVDEERVPVAVQRSAIQRFRDWDVVFVRSGDIYEARPIELGRADDDWIEVKRGLSLGDEYVVKNSFVVKADILKAGAAHDH